MKQLLNILKTTCIFLLFISITGCSSSDDETFAPKPKGYFRLNFPEKKYVQYDSSCPFTFEHPAYSIMDRDRNPGADPCWLNVVFPGFNGTLHLSYKAVNKNVEQFIEDTYTLSSKHQIKASGIEEKLVQRDSSNIYGLIYEVDGNAASALQFYLTDSTKHFIRGALYFNEVPNIDSIAPVLSFIKKDIYHMINTFEWKN